MEVIYSRHSQWSDSKTLLQLKCQQHVLNVPYPLLLLFLYENADFFSCPVLTETTKLSISESNLQTAFLCELCISWKKIPYVQLLSIYIEKGLQDMLNRDLCGQWNARINSPELIFFITKIEPTWKYFEFEISPLLLWKFHTWNSYGVFFGQNLTVTVTKQKMICKRHKVSNKYVLRFFLELITGTCSKFKYFKLVFNVFFLTHLSVLYATIAPLRIRFEHQHLQMFFSYIFPFV